MVYHDRDPFSKSIEWERVILPLNPSLETLTLLYCTWVSDRSLQQMLHLWATNLRHVNLSFVHLSNNTVGNILSHSSIETLVLKKCRDLTASCFMYNSSQTLKKLSVGLFSIEDKQFETFGNNFPNLEDLELFQNTYRCFLHSLIMKGCHSPHGLLYCSKLPKIEALVTHMLSSYDKRGKSPSTSNLSSSSSNISTQSLFPCFSDTSS